MADDPMASLGILTRWAVVRETKVSEADAGLDRRPSHQALQRWFADARRAYVERCPNLREELRGGRARLDGSPRLDPAGEIGTSDAVLVAVSVTELRPTSFDMKVRVRALGEGGSVVAEGRCTLALTDPATGSPLTIPEAVRGDLIGLEHAATDYC